MTFKDLLDEMHETYKKKNSDYGNSFKQTHLQFGEIAGLTRISDKVNRLISLSKKTPDSQNYESKRDTYMDLANYCLMQVLVMEATEDEYEEALVRPCWVKKIEEGIRELENAFETDEYMQDKGPY